MMCCTSAVTRLGKFRQTQDSPLIRQVILDALQLLLLQPADEVLNHRRILLEAHTHILGIPVAFECVDNFGLIELLLHSEVGLRASGVNRKIVC